MCPSESQRFENKVEILKTNISCLICSRGASGHAAPDILVIHMGGNSIGLAGRIRVELLRCMKADVAEIQQLFSSTVILLSDFLPAGTEGVKWQGPAMDWRGPDAGSTEPWLGFKREQRLCD